MAVMPGGLGSKTNLSMTREEIHDLAEAWVDAWNRHDLDAILSHYAEGVEFTSPFVRQVLGSDDPTLRGVDQLRPYFARALAVFPDLRFELYQVLAGAESIVLYYRSVRGLFAAEVMELDGEGRVRRVLAHYSEDPPTGMGA